MIYTAINTLPVRIFPQTRGGAASLFQSGKFFAPVTAPLLFNPLYFGLAPHAIFVVQAGILVLALVPLWLIRRMKVEQGTEAQHALSSQPSAVGRQH